jgi:hemerythrin-like domain-containing protein
MDVHAPGPVPTSQGDDSPIAVLAEEHALILRAVELLERGLARLEVGTSIGGPFFAALVEFFQVFADRYHHGKEEGILFPFMVAEMDYPQVFPTVEDFLGSDERAGLCAAFARFESAEGGQCTAAHRAELIGALERHAGRPDRS